MSESIVQTQNHILSQTQTDVECKELVVHGIYTVCADTGEVVEYDEDKFFVENSEGIDRKSKSDRVFSHYRPHQVLLPNAGIGTIPAGFDKSLTSYSFAFRLSKLITNSMQKTIFMKVAQKIAHKKIKHKLYIIGAFAIRYCSVDFNHVLQLLLNFYHQDEETVRKRLSRAVANLSFILNDKKVDLADVEIQIRKQFLRKYTIDLLNRYGYTKYLDKFSKLYTLNSVKTAVILLLLRDNRREEAKQLYQTPPQYKAGFTHFIVDYEIYGRRYVKKLTHKRLRTLLFSPARLHSFKVVL